MAQAELPQLRQAQVPAKSFELRIVFHSLPPNLHLRVKAQGA